MIGGYVDGMHINWREADGGSPARYLWHKGSGTNWADHLVGGIQSGTFTGSGFTATGWGITNDGDANFRNQIVRGKLTTYEFVQNKISIANGNMIVSDNAKCINTYRWADGGSASPTGAHRRWYFAEPHPFNAYDVIRCKSAGKDYQFVIGWISPDRLCLDSYNCSGSLGDMPSDGDFLVRWDSNNNDRKGLLYLCSSDAGSPNYQVLYGQQVKSQFGNLEGRMWQGTALPANTWGLWAVMFGRFFHLNTMENNMKNG